jgi:hypothetical protein
MTIYWSHRSLEATKHWWSLATRDRTRAHALESSSPLLRLTSTLFDSAALKSCPAKLKVVRRGSAEREVSSLQKIVRPTECAINKSVNQLLMYLVVND